MLDPSQLPQVAAQAQHYLDTHEYQKAIDLYDMCLAVAPDDPQLRYCMGSLYSELYKSGIAISMLRGVVKDVPEHAQAWNNLGIAYKNAGIWDKAHEAYSKALELNYDAMTLVNMSGLFINNGTPQEALKWAEKGLKLAPDIVQLRNHKSLALLELGRWKEGFEWYEARYGLPGWSPRTYQAPMWKGEKVDTLVIHGEQGLGDEILFMNALERAERRVKRVVLECATRLVPVFKDSFNLECYGTEAELKAAVPKCDAWAAMGSLFHVVGWDEHKGKYLKVTKPYQKGEKFRIGISFRGGTMQTHEHLRNFPIEWWSPLWQGLDADIISLQYGPAAGMAAKIGLPHDQAAIDDVERLIGMISSCDLVISPCNTTIHMAGALGVPCWCLVPHGYAWRYYSETDQMLWYESVRLIRQGKDESWRDVINRIRSKLLELDLGILHRAEQAAA